MICWACLYFGADIAQGQGQTRLLCFVAGQWETRRVPLPTFHVSISGSILALYGAVLSTITAAAQIIGHFRDRARLRLGLSRTWKSSAILPFGARRSR